MEDEHGKRINLVTRERLLKGDLEVARDGAGYINKANHQDDSILSHLFTERVLEWQHVAAAASYTLWQYAAYKPFYAEPRRLYLIEILGDPSAGSHSEAAYRKLLRYLHRLDQHNIDTAINQGVDATNRQNIWASRMQFRIAFDSLVTVVNRVADELEALKKAEKEGDNACIKH